VPTRLSDRRRANGLPRAAPRGDPGRLRRTPAREEDLSPGRRQDQRLIVIASQATPDVGEATEMGVCVLRAEARITRQGRFSGY